MLDALPVDADPHHLDVEILEGGVHLVAVGIEPPGVRGDAEEGGLRQGRLVLPAPGGDREDGRWQQEGEGERQDHDSGTGLPRTLGHTNLPWYS
jgi:hypothetical protein